MRTSRKNLGVAFLTILLAGCTIPLPKSCEPVDPKTEMLGMSESETLTCLGAPKHKQTDDESEKWFYAYQSCIVKLGMIGGRVKTVSYLTRSDNGLSQEEQCAKVPIVTSCLRWLRSSTLNHPAPPHPG
jgi:hypothetical protein